MKRKKPIYKRWWFWGLIVIVLMVLGSQRNARHEAPREAAAIMTARPQKASTPPPEATPAPEEKPASPPLADENAIRPEVKEFLDSYEAFIDEYAAFMQRYADADTGDLAAMMGDYAVFMSRYADFAEKLDAMDEDELTNAELAYYLEVTSRASQKLLLAAG